MNEKLPPLPAPAVMGRGDPDGDYSREQVEAIRREAVMLCARQVQALIASHCEGTRKSANRNDWCFQDGRDGCEFVAAWKDAEATIRALLTAPDSRGQSEPARSNEHAHPVIGVVLPSQSVRIGGEGEKL